MRVSATLAWRGVAAILVLTATLSTGCPLLETATLQVDNTTGRDIEELYCTPTTDPSWGPNLLNSPIPAGESAQFLFAPGNYDVQAVLDDGTEVEDEVSLVEGETTTWNVLLSIPGGK